MSYVVVKSLTDPQTRSFIDLAKKSVNLPKFIGDTVVWNQRPKSGGDLKSITISFDDFNTLAKEGVFGSRYQLEV